MTGAIVSIDIALYLEPNTDIAKFTWYLTQTVHIVSYSSLKTISYLP